MSSPSSDAERTSLEPLQRIADKTYIFEPEAKPCDEFSSSGGGKGGGSSSKFDTSPSLIIFCTWIGATPRRVQRYISGQRALWPGASILLLMSDHIEFGFLPRRMMHSDLAIAREAIQRHVDERAREHQGPRILLHVMSNGGLHKAINLVESLQSSRDNGHAPLNLSLHIRGVIFDCVPGRTEFWRTYWAAAASTPKTWLPVRVLWRTYFALAVCLLITGHRSGLLSGAVDTARGLANESGHFGSSNRLYLYTKADPMIGWRDVESHMEDAKTRIGLMVESSRFDDAPHCALVTSDSKRYWDAIQKFWENAVREDGSALALAAPKSRL